VSQVATNSLSILDALYEAIPGWLEEDEELWKTLVSLERWKKGRYSRWESQGADLLFEPEWITSKGTLLSP
jgi:hypothetical protein